jgi:hypothetical protein
MANLRTDLLGGELSEDELAIVDVYERLKALCARDLPPVAAANLEHALAAVYNAVNGLGLIHEHLVDDDAPTV